MTDEVRLIIVIFMCDRASRRAARCESSGQAKQCSEAAESGRHCSLPRVSDCHIQLFCQLYGQLLGAPACQAVLVGRSSRSHSDCPCRSRDAKKTPPSPLKIRQKQHTHWQDRHGHTHTAHEALRPYFSTPSPTMCCEYGVRSPPPVGKGAGIAYRQVYGVRYYFSGSEARRPRADEGGDTHGVHNLLQSQERCRETSPIHPSIQLGACNGVFWAISRPDGQQIPSSSLEPRRETK